MSIDSNNNVIKDLEWAKERIKDTIREDGNLYNGSWYISYIKDSNNVCLDGEFDSDDLLAISIYMNEA